MRMGRNDVVAHNVRFYNPEPRAIHNMALENKTKKLALSRSDNSVEIWDVKFMPHLQKVIFNEPSSTVEGLKWYGSRLFSCGLQGYIVEYDCLNESVLSSVPVIGGPAWCLDINYKTKLAASGTEDGYINIFHITPEGLEHYKFLDKQQGRILCICWERTGQHLVTGSTDVIRVWNVEKGHAIHKMMTGRTENKETIVWSLNVTSDFTIISGDSRGYLCFWDGKLGTQIEHVYSHQADIFAVVLSEDESQVYCSGVDPLISIYARVLENTGTRRKWAKGGNRRIHDLDVRALVLSSDGKLYSGGVDGYLTLSAFAPKLLVKFPPLLKSPCVKTLPSKKYVMLRYLSHLEVWKLGNPAVHQGNCESVIRLAENERQLLLLKARERDVIVSSSISANGEFIVYSTNSSLRFFKLSLDQECSLIKLPDSSDCGMCRLIEFYQVNKRQFCVVVTNRNEIHIMEVGESGPDVVHTIKPKENELLTDTISYLVVTQDGSYLVAADCSGNVVVWSMLDWSYHCNIPRYKAAITAMAVNNKTNCVVVAYSDFKIIEFSLKEKKYTKFSNNLNQDLSGYLHSPVVSVTFDYRRNSSIIVHDDSSMCVLNDDEVLSNSDSKAAKLSDSNSVERKQERNFTLIKKSKHLVSIDWLEGDEMVMVSVCPLKIAENYLPAFDRKRFIK